MLLWNATLETLLPIIQKIEELTEFKKIKLPFFRKNGNPESDGENE